MKLLITGGTGFIGGHSAVAAHRAGHDVRLLVRDPSKGERAARAMGLSTIDLATGDITDRESVEKALVGCDAVLHAAAAVVLDPRRAHDIDRINAEGTRNVIQTAAERGMSVILHVSSTSALAVSRGSALSVDSPVAVATGYAASKAGAELVARGLQEQGAPVHITYPSGVIGPAIGGSLGEASTQIARFIAAGIIPTRHGSISFIDVRDVAEIHRLLLEPGPRPARVMCGGTLVTMIELGRRLRTLTGRRIPTLPIPPATLRAAGRVADRLRTVIPIGLPLTEEGMSIITAWPGTRDNGPADLGIRYRPITETFTDAICAWYAAGLLTRRQAGALVPCRS